MIEIEDNDGSNYNWWSLVFPDLYATKQRANNHNRELLIYLLLFLSLVAI